MAKGPALPPPSRGILGGKTPAPPPPAPSAPLVNYSGHYADTGRGPRPDTGSYRAPPTVLNDPPRSAGEFMGAFMGKVTISALGTLIGLLIWHWLA